MWGISSVIHFNLSENFINNILKMNYNYGILVGLMKKKFQKYF